MKIFRKTPTTRTLFFVFWDIILISLSVYLSFLLRFEGAIPEQYSSTIIVMIFLLVVFSLPIFYFLKLYSFSWSYVSTQELISLFKGVFLSFLLLAGCVFILRDEKFFYGFPRSTYLLSGIFIFLFSGMVRFSKRIYLQSFKLKREEERLRTLIVGAGDAGEQILRSIQRSAKSSYLPVGFVDDNKFKHGSSIHGVPVLGGIDKIPQLVETHQVEEAIIALPSAGSKTIRKAAELGRKVGLKKIKVIPTIGEIINGEVSIRNIREVQVEDLLGRDPVSLDLKSIENSIKNKIILVTGAAGSIGSELSRQIAKFHPSLLLILDQDETGIFDISRELKNKFAKIKISSIITDIRDEEKINQIFERSQPNIIFHAAAYKHVPLMESHPDEAVKNNIFGTEIVAKTALKCKAERFIFISTDKAINPTSVMGATKRAGELICQSLNKKNKTKFMSVRFGNVLDSRGSVIPIFRDQIKRGGPIEVTHPDMKRYFMTIPEACLLVMQAGFMGEGGEVFVLDMGEPINILDLAREMIRFSGLEPDKDIPIVFSGCRPGEKLFEEILSAEEGTMATQNQKIFIAKLSNVNDRRLNENLKKMKNSVEHLDNKAIITILKNIIPSYKPSIKHFDS